MRKFKIPATPKTTNKTIRFPNDILDKVEQSLVGTDCTFSSFIVTATRYALENMEDDENESDKTD